ncbi:TetR/AcrR family transcriptional regulator [Natrarchaeobius halalkaliphilus]|uniref:TetR/AcrR family transcriptional regulator n=1 Tax=Natrarchaeobius halalkaliphilus TaxID=1679091 RepID=A0A3N6LS89_9EURY|nr:TetR/AcrR family transcriptional regulator [Natrarchaeobius halalkaliphilus]RQG92753.1 TetR/AcrR family transcriptional regulator [Natrarchaeobius halalkaliphilus]
MTDPNVRDAIMTATYEALCDLGYTELTAQDIADRTDKSKSLLFYHYDAKEDLIADFLEYLLELFDERIAATEVLSPVERLAAFVDWYLYGSNESEHQSFHTAMLELRAQAPYNDRYRRQLRKSDDRLRATLEEILEDGIDAGQFVEHDREGTAALVIAAIDGSRIRQLTLGRDEYLDTVRSAVVDGIFDELLAEGVAFPHPRAVGDRLDLEPRLESPDSTPTDAETPDETGGGGS